MGRWQDDDTSGSDFLRLLGHRERLNRLFDEEEGRTSTQHVHTNSGWSPATDMYDAGDRFIITAEIPGVEEDAIDLEMSGDALVLTGERIPDTTEKVNCYHRVERPEGPFRRVYRFPEEVDGAATSATYKDGVLIIEVPKAGSRELTVTITIE